MANVADRQNLDLILATLLLDVTALLAVSVLIALPGLVNTLTLSAVEPPRESAVLRPCCRERAVSRCRAARRAPSRCRAGPQPQTTTARVWSEVGGVGQLGWTHRTATPVHRGTPTWAKILPTRRFAHGEHRSHDVDW